MHLTSRWAGARLRAAIRLVAGILLGACALAPDFLDLGAAPSAPFLWATGILSLLMLSSVVATIVRRRFRRGAWVEVLPTIVLLIAVAIVTFALFGTWSGEVAVAGFVAFYVLELRLVVVARPGLYAALVIGGVVLIASLAMADSEAASPDSRIKSARDSLVWAAAQVFRAGALVDYRPVTDTGRFLGFLILAASVFFAAVIFSAGTAWAVRDRRERDGEKDDRALQQQILAALRTAGVIPAAEHPVALDERARVLVHVDDVVGREPKRWLADRQEAVSEFVRTCAALPLREDRAVVAVLDAELEGDGDGAPDSDSLRRLVAEEGATRWLCDGVVEGDIVVSANPEVVATVVERGALLVPCDEWRSAVTGPGG